MMAMSRCAIETRAHFGTNTNDGRANLPVCSNLTASQRAMLAEPWGYARKNIAPLVLVEVWAARPLTFHFSATRQRLPYLGVKLRS
jgi:hypothetical protein